MTEVFDPRSGELLGVLKTRDYGIIAQMKGGETRYYCDLFATREDAAEAASIALRNPAVVSVGIEERIK